MSREVHVRFCESRGVRFPPATHLLAFITSNQDLVSADLQERFYDEVVARRLQYVLRRVDETVRQRLAQREKLTQYKLRKIIDSAITDERAQWDKQDDGPWAPQLDLRRLDLRNRQRVDALIQGVFQQLPLVARQRVALRELILSSLGKRPYWHQGIQASADPSSGLVIAGFGDKEYFPSLLLFEVSGIIDGHLRALQVGKEVITADNSAIIAPFAQREMVDAFLTGMNPMLEGTMKGYWRAMERSYPPAVLLLLQRSVPNLTPAVAASLTGPLTSLVLAVTRDLENQLNKHKDDLVQPILNSVTYLPKDELAAMAESLVNLTSLKRRVSISDPQTVGGPIDVAIISRGDGFVWIKRKHYFEQALNPSWAANHTDT
jgi:hypothetical protein